MYNFTAQIMLSMLFFLCSSVCADSPPTITHSIVWNDSGDRDARPKNGHVDGKGVIEIASAFNHARREEEKQLGLSSNALKDLVLPTQLIWDRMSDDAKALYLINDARTARAGVLPNVLGLPLAGIESSFDLMVEEYAILLHDTNAKGHYQPSGNPAVDNPLKRMEQDPYIGLRTGTIKDKNKVQKAQKIACYESLVRYENVAFFSGYSVDEASVAAVPLAIERSIYKWIYNDVKSGWQYRQTLLLQDKASVGKGFNNNNGDARHEGFLGFHLIGSANYQPFQVPDGVKNYGVAVVMSLLDPIASTEKTVTDCDYSVSIRTEDLPVPTKTLILSSK